MLLGVSFGLLFGHFLTGPDGKLARLTGCFSQLEGSGGGGLVSLGHIGGGYDSQDRIAASGILHDRW